MKQTLMLVTLFLVSCSSVKNLECTTQDKITLKLESEKINRLDIYINDTLLITKMPFEDVKNLTLHNFQVGEYRFIFKTDNLTVETVKLKISDNNINARN
jgi:hypothetical protein